QPQKNPRFPLNSSNKCLRTPRQPPSNSLIGRSLHALVDRRRTPSLTSLYTPSSAAVARPPQPLSTRPRRPPPNVSSVALGSSATAARPHDYRPWFFLFEIMIAVICNHPRRR
ncbi:hypothetical protein LINPERHAP1_LOCUS24939, partial [Linum perenne]